tara:strand:+ start:71 stop:280 length:210 start_codon:yes stop_codon:yes gene_type:complete
MNIYEKAQKYLQAQGFQSAEVVGPKGDEGLYITVWNDELSDAIEVRIHDEEIKWWAEYHEEQQNKSIES